MDPFELISFVMEMVERYRAITGKLQANQDLSAALARDVVNYLDDIEGTVQRVKGKGHPELLQHDLTILKASLERICKDLNQHVLNQRPAKLTPIGILLHKSKRVWNAEKVAKAVERMNVELQMTSQRFNAKWLALGAVETKQEVSHVKALSAANGASFALLLSTVQHLQSEVESISTQAKTDHMLQAPLSEAETARAVAESIDAMPEASHNSRVYLQYRVARLEAAFKSNAVTPVRSSSIDASKWGYEEASMHPQGSAQLILDLALDAVGDATRQMSDPEAELDDVLLALRQASHALFRASLIEEAIQLTQALLAFCRAEAAADAGSRSILSATLNRLAFFKIQLGQYEEALPLSMESVAIFRELCREASSPHLQASLAKCLHNLADIERSLGHKRQAIETSQESVALWRTLDGQDPPLHQGGLARALYMLSICLFSAGDITAAATMSEELVRRTSELHAHQPGHYAHQHAVALSHLALCQSQLGHPASLESSAESVQILKGLMQERPASFRYQYATALRLHAVNLAHAARSAEAEAAAEHSVALWRTEAALRPARCAQKLKAALQTLADIQSNPSAGGRINVHD